MKPAFYSILFILFFIPKTYSQQSGLDTWSIGAGLNNTLILGDLTSLNSENNEPINTGFYLYVDKMISSAFGFELKIQSIDMKGSSQDIAAGTTNNLFFEGSAFGGELNAIINLNGLGTTNYTNSDRKINFSTYLGLGFHTYDSKLFNANNGELITDFEEFSGRDGKANSIYFTSGLGIRYKLNSKFDLELRQTINFNNEDHLDALPHQKQNFETFFVTNLGVVYKLNKKGKENIIWQDNIVVEKQEIIEQVVEQEPTIEIKDTDGDGVIDQLDKEPNTPRGAITYGNGIAIDTDKDGVIDFIDKCPLVFGTKELKGCPEEKDTDGDGVIDKNDLCPHVIGPIDNQGCPVSTNTITEIEKTKIISLAKNIYFESGKSFLTDSSKNDLDKIGAIMQNYPSINFVVEGHTDSGGKRIYNLKLSQDRADAVKKYLSQTGVDTNNLSAIGYGFSRPKYNNVTSDGRQLNRRVEIKINDPSAISEDSTVIYKDVVEETYIIKSFDTLFSIAKNFNVTVNQLKEWNNLTNNNIIIGAELIIKH
jgi:outer membrane protein OmpA-like peptidoglycan-associated protein